MTDCPYCGKELTKGERYCYFCERDLSEIADKEESPNKEK